MIKEALRSHLVSDSAVHGFIANRAFPMVMPQGTIKPAITYNVDSDEQSPLIDGGVSTLREALFSIDCWADTALEAEALVEAVEDSLLNITTGQLGVLVPPQLIDLVRQSRGNIDLFEPDTKLYRVATQFSVAYYP